MKDFKERTALKESVRKNVVRMGIVSTVHVIAEKGSQGQHVWKILVKTPAMATEFVRRMEYALVKMVSMGEDVSLLKSKLNNFEK